MKINLQRRIEPEDFTFRTCNFQEQLQVVALSVFWGGLCMWFFFFVCWDFGLVCFCGSIFLFDKVVTSLRLVTWTICFQESFIHLKIGNKMFHLLL